MSAASSIGPRGGEIVNCVDARLIFLRRQPPLTSSGFLVRSALAVVAAVIAISFSDWLFFGVLFHDRYNATPELWRTMPEGRKIGGSMLFAAIGSAAFFMLAAHFRVAGIQESLILALLCWIAASLPQTVTNTLYLRYDKILLTSHSLGWLARLVLAGVAYGVVSA